MTKLKCSVKHCSSNADNYCCRPHIHVGGRNAVEPSQTLCDSFTGLPQGTTNFVGYDQINPEMPVSCDAVNCIYNDDKMCVAESIQIQGPSAESTEQTQCATFRTRESE